MFNWCPLYGTNASRPYTVKLNSTVRKKGKLGDLGRESKYKVLLCICMHCCDKQSASSLLTAEQKKKRMKIFFPGKFQSFSSFHHLSSIFCLHCYNEIISLFKSYRSFDHWCAMAEFFLLVSLLLWEQRGKA